MNIKEWMNVRESLGNFSATQMKAEAPWQG